MVGNFDPITRGHIWNFLVWKYGLDKKVATTAIAQLEADTVTMLLLPGPPSGMNWTPIWQFSSAAYRKYKGQNPIVLDVGIILGGLGL